MNDGKTSQEVTDLIDYRFGGGALSLVVPRPVYTGKLQQNQGDPDKRKRAFRPFFQCAPATSLVFWQAEQGARLSASRRFCIGH